MICCPGRQDTEFLPYAKRAAWFDNRTYALFWSRVIARTFLTQRFPRLETRGSQGEASPRLEAFEIGQAWVQWANLTIRLCTERCRFGCRRMSIPEAIARQKIDASLEEAGWCVQDNKDLNLMAGPGVAIREFPCPAADLQQVLTRMGAALVGATPCGCPAGQTDDMDPPHNFNSVTVADEAGAVQGQP